MADNTKPVYWETSMLKSQNIFRLSGYLYKYTSTLLSHGPKYNADMGKELKIFDINKIKSKY